MQESFCRRVFANSDVVKLLASSFLSQANKGGLGQNGGGSTITRHAHLPQLPVLPVLPIHKHVHAAHVCVCMCMRTCHAYTCMHHATKL